MARIRAGTDIGKTHHHCVVLNAEGERLLSRRVLNDEPELLALLADVLAPDVDVVWAVDVADGMAALWISVLLNHGLVYIPVRPRCDQHGERVAAGRGARPRRADRDVPGRLPGGVPGGVRDGRVEGGALGADHRGGPTRRSDRHRAPASRAVQTLG